jgi:hypothetical protein
MNEPVSLDLTIKSLPVTLKNGEGEVHYELREMTSLMRDQFLDKLAARTRLDVQGRPVGLNKFEGLQSDLLSRCLYRDGKLVLPVEIQGWPSSVVSELYKRAQEINYLNEVESKKATEEAKKD